MTITYRAMWQSDVPQCMRLAREGWDQFAGQVAQPEFTEMFASNAWRPFFYVAEEDGYPPYLRGMAGWNASWLTYGIYNLFWVAVQKDYRKRGIGACLVERCLDDLRPVANAVMLMTGVPEFYIRWGFEPLGDIPNAEGFGTKLMVLQLNDKSLRVKDRGGGSIEPDDELPKGEPNKALARIGSEPHAG